MTGSARRTWGTVGGGDGGAKAAPQQETGGQPHRQEGPDAKPLRLWLAAHPLLACIVSLTRLSMRAADVREVCRQYRVAANSPLVRSPPRNLTQSWVYASCSAALGAVPKSGVGTIRHALPSIAALCGVYRGGGNQGEQGRS
jgi:hypothetical protein